MNHSEWFFIITCNFMWAHYEWTERVCSPVLPHWETRTMAKLSFVPTCSVLLVKGLFYFLLFCFYIRLLWKQQKDSFKRTEPTPLKKLRITKYVFEGATSRSDCGYKYTWVTAWNTWVNSALSFGVSLHWIAKGHMSSCDCVAPLLSFPCFYVCVSIAGIVEACILSFAHLKNLL